MTRAAASSRALRRLHRALAPMLPVFALSCAEPSGIVELDWAFIDRTGEPIFPGGKLLQTRDTCSLPGRDSQGTRDYKLQARLVLLDPECEADAGETGETGDAGPSSCEVASAYFPCDRARGALTEVPPSDTAYNMQVEVWATPKGEDGPSFEVRPECMGVPGPRSRKVSAGHITDLAVYQLVAFGVDQDDSIAGGLDLVGCRS